jgi:acetyl esterase/lipase
MFPKTGSIKGIEILFHGGGWYTGGVWQFTGDGYPTQHWATALADHGIAVFNVNYDLAQISPIAGQWAKIWDDAENAVSFVDHEATSLGVDSSHIGALGVSAGAQIVELLGDKDKVANVVALSGPSNLSALLHEPTMLEHLDDIFGSSMAQLNAASPIDNISSTSTDFLILQGDEDYAVSASSAQKYYTALLNDGVNATFDLFQGGHALWDTKSNVVMSVGTEMLSFLLTQDA